jgi:hypothetical protein
MITHAEIEERLRQFSDYEFSGSVPEDLILAAQLEFEGRFSADFINFLKEYGSGYISSEEFIGLGGKNHLNIINVANHLRRPSTHSHFPPFLVPIRADGFGNYDCIDLSASDDAHSRVVLWNHAAGDQLHPEVLADGYWEWFNGVLDILAEMDAQAD